MQNRNPLQIFLWDNLITWILMELPLVMVQTSLKNLENLEIWLLFWKVRENLEKSGRKFQKFFKSWRSQGGFFDKADKPIFRLFLLKLKSKMCVLCFLHDRLFIFDLFFNILIIGVLIVNCVLYLVFFSKHSCFQGCIAYWCRISSILCLLCDSCFLHFESWYEVYCWHEIILFTDACFLNVLKISPSVPMV